MDKIDRNIIKILLVDSRTPALRIARHIKTSREVVDYRIKRLQKEGVIREFITEIDFSKLGFVGAAIFVNVKSSSHQQFKNYLEHSPVVSWVAELSGVWSYGFSIIGKSNEELGQRFLHIQSQFKGEILDHRFVLHKKNQFFYEKYFTQKLAEDKKETMPSIKMDKVDKIILKELARNSRIDTVQLSKMVSLSAPAVAKRIRKLKSTGVIEKFSLFIDASSLELYQYSVFITNKEFDQKHALIGHLRNHPHVSFIAEYVGDAFIEFGVFVNNPYQLRAIIQGIEDAFPANRVMELSMFQKEFVSISPPSCVFE